MMRTPGEFTGLYICYWSLRDPLCQTQSLAYLRGLAAEGWRFVLITFEQPPYTIADAEAEACRRELAEQGIAWHPLRYHKGLALLGKLWDWLQGVWSGICLTWRYRPQVIHSRATIPGIMAMVVAGICRKPFLYDADGALHEEYADIGHWQRRGLAFRLTAAAERRARRSADAVVVLSEFMRAHFIECGVRAPITVIPCCVNLARFRFDPVARQTRRTELGLRDERLFVYVGKASGWYLMEETFEFFRVVGANIGPARLLILSPHAPEVFDALALRHAVPRDQYVVKRASHAEVAEWLSAADVGLALSSRLPSKRGSSLVKVGEYLAAGLPVVITNDIGDYSDLIARERVGVVLESDTAERYRAAAGELQTLWQEGPTLRERCRAVAEAHVSLDTVGVPRYRHVYEKLLGVGEQPAS